ncbi:MAG: endo-1,4-beta-xylanase [Verrucomicrobiota bacterium]
MKKEIPSAVIGCLGFLLANSVFAADLPAGKLILPATISAFQLGGKSVQDAQVKIVSIPGQPFSEALQVQTLKRPPYPWNITLAAPTTGAIYKGDVLLASLMARQVESRQETGEALLELIVEENQDEHHKLLELATSVGPEWTPIRAPFVADSDYAAGAAMVSLRFGYQPQTVEVAAITLNNFAATAALKDLPRTTAHYAGWETNAPWRHAAAERIEKIRKGDLRVEVVNAQGKPVADAKVVVRMLRHEFAFGTAIMGKLITATNNPDRDRYRETIEKYFNKVVFENELKWPAWQTNRAGWQENRSNVFATLNWLNARNIAVRGHVMIWPSWENTPGWLRQFESQADKLQAAIDEHFADQTTTLKGRLDEWDVINESYAHNDVLKVLGREEMARWFKLANQGDPSVKLFYNDYIMFAGSGEGSPSQYFFDTIKFFKDRGAPIGGIGEQGHFGGSPPSPEKVLATFDRFGTLGLPIQISEFDIDTSDEELQVHYTRDFMTACFSHPAVSGVMMWGFWEGAHWRPRAALWNKDWTLRPNGQVWLDLVTKEWWTNTNGMTAADGKFFTRGFCGDYEITVQSVQKQTTKKISLTRAGTTVRVEMN